MPADGLRQWEWYYLKRLCRVEPVRPPGQRKTEVNSVGLQPRRATPRRRGRRMGPSRSGTLETGRVLHTLKADTDFVYAWRSAPTASTWPPRARDGKVRVWDLTTGQEVFTAPGTPASTTGRRTAWPSAPTAGASPAAE